MLLSSTLARVVLRHWVPRLLPAYFAVLFLISQLDAITNWPLLREQLREAPPSQLGIMAVFLLGAWSLLSGLALRGVVNLAPLRWLRRQPIEDGAFGAAAIFTTYPIWPVAIAFAWLIQPLPTWLLLALPLVLTCALTSWLIGLARPIEAAVGLGVLGGTVALSAWSFWTAPIVTVALLAMTPLLGQRIQQHGTESTKTAQVRATRPDAHPAVALSRLHRICISREHGNDRWSIALFGLFAAALLAAFRWNGELQGEALWLAFVVLMLLMSFLVYGALEHLAATLATPKLLAFRAPLSPTDQLTGLSLTAASLLAPASALLIAIAAGAGGIFTWLVLFPAAVGISLSTLVLLIRVRYLPRSNALGVFAVLAFGAALALIHQPVIASLALTVLPLLAAHSLLKKRRSFLASPE